MNTIILEILQFDNNVYISTENLAILSIYSYLQYPQNIQLEFNEIICIKLPENYFKLKSKLSTFNCFRKYKPTLNLRTPIFINENVYTSGLCAVARKIIQSSKYGNDLKLLGFKNSCLQAPTEASLWTRFCEIEMITAVNKILKHNFIENENFIIPSVFGKFEAHLNQPVRMHNIFKVARETNSHPSLLHKFAEGIYLTLADILLYFSFFFILSNLPNQNELIIKFPLLFKWLDEVKLNCFGLNDILKEIDLLCCKKLNNFSISYSLIEENQQSLYKSDPKRYKPKSRIFTIQNNIDENLEKFKILNLNISSRNEIITKKKFQWSDIPNEANLENGNVPQDRLKRKQQQLENLINVICSIAKDDDIIVDFCSGSGHLGIILAYILPQCTIIFLENKPFSIDKCKQRIDKLKLTNCLFYQSNIDYFTGDFNIGVSLHACGTATDIVLTKCILKKANFVCCPCCYGSINPMPHINYPRSAIYSTALTEKDYLYLAHAADQTQITENYNFNLDKNVQGEFCMDLIDTDRKLFAIEMNYKVILTTLKPENCTLKNRLLIGSFDFGNRIKEIEFH